MDIFAKHPELKKQFDALLQTRRNEILNYMLETDKHYQNIVQARTQASMSLKNKLIGSETNTLFEEYSDAIYAQEIYELDAIYTQAFIDAIITIQEQGLL